MRCFNILFIPLLFVIFNFLYLQKPMYAEIHVPQCQFLHRISHPECFEIRHWRISEKLPSWVHELWHYQHFGWEEIQVSLGSNTLYKQDVSEEPPYGYRCPLARALQGGDSVLGSLEPFSQPRNYQPFMEPGDSLIPGPWHWTLLCGIHPSMDVSRSLYIILNSVIRTILGEECKTWIPS
jgi:hypothetical protein